MKFKKAILGILLSTGFLNAVADEAENTDVKLSRIEIRRTTDGIPHVLAHSWHGLGYGYGYVQAEDALCTLAEAFTTFRGRRSYFFGADSRPRDMSTFGHPRNIDLDFFFQAFANDGLIAEYQQHQPPSLNELIEGFAAGYNRYLRDARNRAEPEFASPCLREYWVDEITVKDIFRRVIAANLAAGYAPFIPEIVNAFPPSADRSDNPAGDDISVSTLPTRIDTRTGSKADVGSNFIAYGKNATGTESGLLFGNPHWFWSGPDRFYQAQLTIPGKLNVSGVSFLGYPVIMIGFNEQVAWSHTFSTAQRFGLFELALDSARPTTYQVDGISETMYQISITVETRDAEGNSVPITRTLYRTRYGPVIDFSSLNKAFGWNASTALAIRDVNENNFRTLRTFFYWNQSQSLNEFADIQRREVGMNWVNTAAVAGNDGRAWYNDIGAMPNVPDELRQRCVPTLAKVYPFTLFLDGSRSACEWIIDPRATQTGAVPAVIQPELFREDYVANMNDSYWSSNPQHPLEGYPSVMGSERSPLTLRTRLGHHIARSTMNKGERTPDKLSKRVRAAVLDARIYSAELFKKPVLAYICQKHYVMLELDSLTDTTFLPSRRINISEACRILRKWPNSGNASDRGGLIWDAFWTRIEKIPKAELYHLPFSPTAPLETPNALNVNDPRVTQAFGAGVLAISASKLAMNASRGSYLYARNGGYRIPLYGGCPIAGYFAIACDENGYEMTRTSYGNSYMQVVSFGKEGVEAYTLLSHGLSDALFESGQIRDTDSNLRRYANKEWLPFPFREADIMRDPKLKRTVLYPDPD